MITDDEIRTCLPFPVCHAGYVFMAYAEAPGSPPHLCECARSAVGHYIHSELAKKKTDARQGRPLPLGRHNFVIGFGFPAALRDWLWLETTNNEAVFEKIRFRANLCHRCHKAVPPFREMESDSFFEKVFRRIIYHDLYTAGFNFVGAALPHVETILQKELLPEDYSQLVEEERRLSAAFYAAPAISPLVAPVGYWRERHQAGEEFHRVSRRVRAVHQTVKDFVEERLREHYAFPKFKVRLQRETVLYLNLRTIYRHENIERHARPSFLGGLELDIWIPDLRVGVEFQGAQHLTAFDYLGGDAGLQKTQERDQRKVKLCALHGVKLVHFFEDDDLNESAIATKMTTSPGTLGVIRKRRR